MPKELDAKQARLAADRAENDLLASFAAIPDGTKTVRVRSTRAGGQTIGADDLGKVVRHKFERHGAYCLVVHPVGWTCEECKGG